MSEFGRDRSSAQLRVAVLSTAYAPWLLGGAERSVKELCEGLQAQGHTVRVLTLAPARGANANDVVDGVDVRRHRTRAFSPFESGGENRGWIAKLRSHIGELARVGSYNFIARELKEFGPDVIHLNNIAGFGWTAWAAVRNYPSVQTLRDYYLCCLNTTTNHGGVSCDKPGSLCRVARLPFRFRRIRPDIFVGVSRRMLEILYSRSALFPAEKAVVVYNQPADGSVDTRRLDAPTDDPVPGVFTFGILGRIGSDKGTWLAIEAFEKLQRTTTDQSVRLLIAGGGTEADLARVRLTCDLNQGVEFLGMTSATDFHRQVDVALVPTQWEEPFGRVAAEALHADTVLLVSNTGGLAEVTQIYGGRFKLIDAFRDPNEWHLAMVAALRGEVAAQPSTTSSMSSTTTQYENIYRTAISQRSSVARGEELP